MQIARDKRDWREKRDTQNQGFGVAPFSHFSRVTQPGRWRTGA